jgi:steroid delta-isomerase-like uncharacterized protein
MQSTMLEPGTASSTQEVVEKYFSSGHDVQYLAEDTVFTDMSSGKQTVGREGVQQFLNYMYHVAFDAKAEVTNKIFTENRAVMEFNFRGRHIGEFAGLQPTNKEVNAPVCVIYEIEDKLIKRSRIYFLADTLMRQLNESN